MEKLSTDRLSEATGVPTRTLRLWTEKGILPRPGAGRYAGYPDGTEETVRRAKALQEQGLATDAIRHVLANPAAPGGAGAYLDDLRRAGVFKGVAPPEPPGEPAPAPQPTPSPAEPGRERTLVRIDVTPTVHLVAEGPLDGAALDALRRAALAAWAVLDPIRSIP